MRTTSNIKYRFGQTNRMKPSILPRINMVHLCLPGYLAFPSSQRLLCPQPGTFSSCICLVVRQSIYFITLPNHPFTLPSVCLSNYILASICLTLSIKAVLCQGGVALFPPVFLLLQATPLDPCLSGSGCSTIRLLRTPCPLCQLIQYMHTGPTYNYRQFTALSVLTFG
jgi:hypothetical protein